MLTYQGTESEVRARSDSQELKTFPTCVVERIIARWQGVQKSHPFGSGPWEHASLQLQPLFDEMARRQKAGAL